VHYGFFINKFSTRATTVRASSITKGAAYPPDVSSTLFAAVATKDPAMEVNVIIAMLFGKCFIPKNEDVNAAVIVGHVP